MPFPSLRDYLDNRRVMYSSIPHKVAYTSRATARSAHVEANEFAKPVIVKVDGELAMVVIPGDEEVNLIRVREVTHAREVELASENEFEGRFPDCEAGAMPPLGNLYGVPMIVSKKLATQERIAFNGGTHAECVLLSYGTYESLFSPEAAVLPL